MTEARLWNIYQAINDWVKFADAKAGVALAAHGAVFTIAVPEIVENRSYFLEHGCLAVGLVCATVAAIVSVFFGLRAIIPRLSVGEAKSLIFFAHIAKAYPDFESFRSHSKGHYSNDDGFNDQILDQIWANARVAWAKHKDSAFCLWALVIEAGIATGLFLFSLLFT
jgi:hypothetical protein